MAASLSKFRWIGTCGYKEKVTELTRVLLLTTVIGMPPHNEFDKTKWNEVQDLAEAWLCGNSTIPSDSMSSFRGVHKIGFLDALLIALRSTWECNHRVTCSHEL